MMAFEVSSDVTAFAGAVDGCGGRAFLVDSAVVDGLAGIKPSRIDLVVIGLDQKTVGELVEKAARSSTGRRASRSSFVAAGGIPVSVSTGARGRKRSRSAVVSLPNVAIGEALLGRVFSVETILYDPLTGSVEDPFGGLADLELGRLSVVDGTQGHDQTAPLRGASLAARYGLSVDPATAAAMRNVASSDVPAHFVWRALEEILIDCERPSIGLEALAQMGVLDAVAPGLAALAGHPQDPVLHPEGDAWVHTRLVANEARLAGEGLDRTSRLRLSVAALCHDIGKPGVTSLVGDRLVAGGHERLGVAITTSLLSRIGGASHLGADGAQVVAALVRHHLLPVRLYGAGRPLSPRLARRIARAVDVDLLYRLALSDGLGRGEPARTHLAADWFRRSIDKATAKAGSVPSLVDSPDAVAFGARPGPEAHAVTEALVTMQNEGTVCDRDSAHRAVRRLLDGKATDRTVAGRPTRMRPQGRKTLTANADHD